MAAQTVLEVRELETELSQDRGRLVRLCARLSGDADAAEDLAQETLLEALRHLENLRDPERRSQWLSGIARNVCLRWTRTRAQQRARLLQPQPGAEPSFDLEERLAGGFDLELELERDELATLLDRAMGLLPAQTRRVLVERYIGDSPHAEIAARLGLSEGAVKMKLQRGKLVLRRLLTTELREEAAGYGLVESGADQWQESRIWCPYCGGHHLLGYFSHDERDGAFILRCPVCHPDDETGVYFVRTIFADFPHTAPLLDGVSGFRCALSRVMAHTYTYYERALAERAAPCMRCGHLTPLRLDLPLQLQRLGLRGVQVICETCGCVPEELLRSLILTLPEGRRFWRDHPRIRTLPERELEAQGRDALLVSFESLRDPARLDAVVDRDTYQVMSINGVP